MKTNKKIRDKRKGNKVNIILAITKKNFTLYIKKGPVFVFGLLFPFFILISWVLGRNITQNQIFIGIVSMTSFFTATAISPVILPIETREKSLERILTAPVSINEMLLGIVLASTFYSVIITSIIAIIFAIALSELTISVLAGFTIFIGILLMGILGSLIAMLISAKPADQTSDIMVLVNLIKFPLIFLGGVFIPLQKITSFTTFLYLISPLTYLSELLRFSVNENSIIQPWLNLLILCGWIVHFYFLNILIHKKTMPKRFSESNKKKMKKNAMKDFKKGA